MVLNFEKENLIEGFSKSLSFKISLSTWEPFKLPDWQAIPLEHAIPFISKLNSSKTDFYLLIGKHTFNNV